MRWPWSAALLVGLTLGLEATPASAHPPPWAVGSSRPEDLVVSLVTFGPGSSVHQVFGHSALLIRDERLRTGRLYNYGMFSFGSDMLARFVRGRLTFWVGEESPREAFARYRSEGRDIHLQALALTPQKRRQVAEFLVRAVLPENREYLYDHYRDNCSTRLASIINRATDGQFEAALRGPGRMTLRDHTRRYVEHEPVIEFLMMHAMGGSVDRPITRFQELFLPAELESAVHLARVGKPGDAHPLEAERRILFRAARSEPPALPKPLWPWTLAVGLLLGKVVCYGSRFGVWSCSGTRRAVASSLLVSLGVVLGLLGTLTALLTFASDHEVAHRNVNVLLSNPLAFGFCGLGLAELRQSRHGRRWLLLTAAAVGLPTLAALLLELCPGIHQENADSLCLLVPPNLAVVGMALLAHLRPVASHGRGGHRQRRC